MKSIRHIFRIGHGPSSSHTMGPQKAAAYLKKQYPLAIAYEVILYGSLAFTGRGHLTDRIIIDTFASIPCQVKFDYKTKVDHVNTMDVFIHLDENHVIRRRVISLGGGAIQIEDEPPYESAEIYHEENFEAIKAVCEANKWRLYQYVEAHEGESIYDYLRQVWSQMLATIERGLHSTGFLPGKLKVHRRAPDLATISDLEETSEMKTYRTLSAYAFATGEENASGGLMVTAPTCGSAGTLPAVLKYLVETYHYDETAVLRALATAGIIGNVVKQNASISGAEAGCQAEIGTACSMAAAAYAELLGLDLQQIESAAEIALEHNLGLTCDPIGGYVQIPCIERNAVAAIKALTATSLAKYIAGTHAISFDSVVKAMLLTGKDIKTAYRETSKGGLAYLYKDKVK